MTPRCTECGAAEPDWDAREASPDSLRAEIDRLRDDLGAALVRENNLREALVQIETVCKDNAVVGNTALALKFVREIAERGHQQKGK